MGFFNFKREIKWDKDVMKVTDSVSNIWDSLVDEMSNKLENEQTSEVLRHFNIDMSELREYLRDKEEWKRKQAAAMPRWIPVTERLPKVGEEVLIHAVDKDDDFPDVITISHRMIFRLFPSSEGAETWASPWPSFMTNYEITHWMPLPEPPKEEDDA